MNCKEHWNIPITDIVVTKSDNDLQYEKYLNIDKLNNEIKIAGF
jgi:hypothetical protein